MTHYTPDTPRTAIVALAAIALSVATLGALVGLPAARDAGAAPAPVVARQAEPVEVAISPARIDVIALRAPNVAWAMPDDGKPNCKPEV